MRNLQLLSPNARSPIIVCEKMHAVCEYTPRSNETTNLSEERSGIDD